MFIVLAHGIYVHAFPSKFNGLSMLLIHRVFCYVNISYSNNVMVMLKLACEILCYLNNGFSAKILLSVDKFVSSMR